MNKLNDFEASEREMIVFDEPYDEKNYARGGVRNFYNMKLQTVKLLVKMGYLDPEDYQNLSPSVQEFVDFMESQGSDNWVIQGYVVSPSRPDCRITLTGIESKVPVSWKDAVDFLKTFRNADILDVDENGFARCWFD